MLQFRRRGCGPQSRSPGRGGRLALTGVRRLPKTKPAFRIGDPQGRFPIWSPEGARRVAGRWHEVGAAVIYASEAYSTAMLEKLAHWNGIVPDNQHFVKVTIPRGTSYEVATSDALPGWDTQDCRVSRSFAHAWYEEKRSAILLVPSLVARMERNVIINSRHPEFANMEVSLETPVWWDRRLFLTTA